MLYFALTVVITYPLIFVASHSVSRPTADPLLNTWILWWNTQRWPLTESWWNAPMFYPAPGAMAFSELLIGLLPVTAPIQWASHNPALAHNVAVFASFPLCALAAWALALELTGRYDAALLAGLAFGFSGYRANEFGHVQMLAYYWAPVALLALHRYRRMKRWGWLSLFAAAWLMQALGNGYAIFHLSILITLWLVWFSASFRDLQAIGIAWACGSLPLIPILLKYRQVHGALHLERSIYDIKRFSADVAALANAPSEVVLWHRLLPSESNALFPGMTIVVIVCVAAVLQFRHRASVQTRMTADRKALAAIALGGLAVAGSALVIGPWKMGALRVTDAFKPFTIATWAGLFYFVRGPRWRKVWNERSVLGFYAVAAVVFYVLAFGPEPTFGGKPVFYKPPYAWLLQLPGFQSIRAPVRFAMLAVLCLSIVVAVVYAKWVARVEKVNRGVFVALALGLVADGWIRVPMSTVPPPGPVSPWPNVSAVLELPMHTDRDPEALYRSIGSERPLINGASGYSPPHYYALTYALETGDMSVINELTRYGPIGVAIDRTSLDHDVVARAVSQLRGAVRLEESSMWSMYVIPETAQSRPELGRSLGVKRIVVNTASDQVERLRDHRIETHWSSGTQRGNEEVRAELETEAMLGTIVLYVGSCPFAFPRDLAVDVSRDGVDWTSAWRGRTATATVRGGLDDPSSVPVAIQFPARTARFIRLTQHGHDENVRWCIAELAVHEPATH